MYSKTKVNRNEVDQESSGGKFSMSLRQQAHSEIGAQKLNFAYMIQMYLRIKETNVESKIRGFIELTKTDSTTKEDPRKILDEIRKAGYSVKAVLIATAPHDHPERVKGEKWQLEFSRTVTDSEGKKKKETIVVPLKQKDTKELKVASVIEGLNEFRDSLKAKKG